MAKYRNRLPQLNGAVFITDGGIETTLIFNERCDLPENAAFPLVDDDKGRSVLIRYFSGYAELAKKHGVGLILDSPTWRGNPEWAEKIGYTRERLAEANRKSIEILEIVRDKHETSESPMVISGAIGPRGDGYVPSKIMNAAQAEDYHSLQIATFSETNADMVTAFTFNYVDEAIGVANAAKACGIPAAVSFTVESDGNLPTGQTLQEGIEQTDEATDGYVAYYMINCAHPVHFKDALAKEGDWRSRIRGIRANASKLTHEELDGSVELDRGDPEELSEHYPKFRDHLPNLNVIGGCCGTDHRHIDKICSAFLR
jgi:S-methylmethionine-dependent homocysteine/selenocysteine methylase